MTPFQFLVAALTLWALLSLGTAVVGLYARPNDRWRGFWFMSGLWGLIDGAIAWYGLIAPPPPTDELILLLRVNSGLDVLYLITGGLMLLSTKPILRGFAYAILLQGLCLLVLDVLVWQWCERLAG